MFEAVLASTVDRKQSNILSTKWERTWKWDGEKCVWFCRCRYVAREFKWKDPGRTDVFAATTSSSTARVLDCTGLIKHHARWVLDVSTAFYNAVED